MLNDLPEPHYKVNTANNTKSKTNIIDLRNNPPKEPTVSYTPKVFQMMKHIIAECDKEVGWMALVETINESKFLITEIFVPKQTVHSAETDIDIDAIDILMNRLIDEDKDPSKLMAWYHSHANMPVTPSPQDEDEVAEFLKAYPIFIRGIMNKHGAAKVDVYYRDHGIAYTNVPTQVQFTPMTTETKTTLNKTLKENVIDQIDEYPYPVLGQGFHPYEDEGWKGYKKLKHLKHPIQLRNYGSDWTEEDRIELRPINWEKDTSYLIYGLHYDKLIAPTLFQHLVKNMDSNTLKLAQEQQTIEKEIEKLEHMDKRIITEAGV